MHIDRFETCMKEALNRPFPKDLAFGHGALTSSEDAYGSHHYHFDREDPKSTAAALETCLSSGISLRNGRENVENR